MGNTDYKQINIFIINPQDIPGIYDIFPKKNSNNDIYEERLFQEKTFNWRGIFYKGINLDNILERIKEKILEIKQEENIQNNIIIANNISKDPLFEKILEINKKLSTKILVIYISPNKLENIKKFDWRTIINIYGDKISDKEFMKETLKYILIIKDCFFNQRSFEFKHAFDGNNIPTNTFLNILMHGQSRSGKSTFCNKILNEYEALESSASESVTYVTNEDTTDPSF